MAFSFFNRDPFLHDGCYASGASVCEDDNKLDKAMLKCVWSPCVWKDGKRSSANFLYADWIGMDFDDGDPTLIEFSRSICDHKRIIGVTKNHQKEKHGKTCDRFRVAIPLEHRITDLDVFLGTMDAIKKKYPAVDAKALLASQYYRTCRELFVVDYKDQDLFSWPVSPPRRKVVFAPVRKADPGAVPYHTPAINKLFNFNGKYRHDTLLLACHDLARQGYDEEAISAYVWDCIPTVNNSKNPGDDFTDKEKRRIISDAVTYINGIAVK